MQDTEEPHRPRDTGHSSRLLLCALFLAALGVRLICLPTAPFFADVPDNVGAINSGRMHIQFPGYVPFHLIIAGLRLGLGDTFSAMVLFSLICGLGAMLYMVFSAELLGGRTAGLVTAAVGGFGLIGTYFSVVGSSYTTDLLATAGALYHGLRAIRATATGRHALWVFAWCCFGLLMRPLSGMWLLPAGAYMIWRYGGGRDRGAALMMIMATAVLAIAVSAPFFGSFGNVVQSSVGLRAIATDALSGNQVAAALIRLVGFPLYFFHIWLLLGIGAVWQASRQGFSPFEREAGVFLLILAGPYCVVLLRHIPQAGYLCFLAPIVILCPFIFRRFGWRRLGVAAAIFAALALAQLFALRPIPPASSTRVIADAYFLQYSRAGIKAGMFETLASLALKAGALQQELPDSRREDILLRKTK